MQILTLKQYRMILNKSTREFALELGYNPTYINSIESGKRCVSENLLEKLNFKYNLNKTGFIIINSIECCQEPNEEYSSLKFENDRLKEELSNLNDYVIRMMNKFKFR